MVCGCTFNVELYVFVSPMWVFVSSRGLPSMSHPPPANEAARFSHQGCQDIKISRYNIDSDVDI